MRSRAFRQVTGMIIAFIASFITILIADRVIAGDPTSIPSDATLPPGAVRRLLPPEEQARRYQSGPAWDGIGRGTLTQADIDSFGDYPLFWLGESFGGYNLWSVSRTRYTRQGKPALATGPNSPPIPLKLPPEHDSIAFTYGGCIPLPAATSPQGEPGGSSCSPPVSVIVEPGCQVRPEWVADRVKARPLATARGQGQLQQFSDGHVQLWTGRVTISIHTAADPRLIDQAVQQLRGVGANTPLGAGHPLGPPDFSGC